MIRDLNIDQIKKIWFLSLVIQFKSFKQAALHAKVTPSAVSQAISSLETAYGQPLLIRDRGVILPTQEGIALLAAVRPAFEVFDQLNNLKSQPAPKITWMNFGTYESIAIDLLPGFLHSLRTQLPNLRLGLRISRTSNLVTMVKKGELCSAIITQVDDLEKFFVKEVAEDRLGFFASKSHPVADMGWKGIEHFGYGSLAPGKDGLPRYYMKFMKQFNLPRPLMLSDSFEALRMSASSGAIVSVLPTRVARRNNDLIEIFPGNASKKNLTEKGQHKILAIGQATCDKEEVSYVASEAQRILNRKA